MNTRKLSLMVGMIATLVWGLPLTASTVHAQTSLSEANAGMKMMDNLNSASPGPSINSGFNPIQRARDARDQAGGNLGAPGAPGGMMMPPGTAYPSMITSALPESAGPTITVIAGTRVFSSVPPYQLLDDPVKKKVRETEKDKYFDDGSHGDLISNDQEYTKVDERRDVLGLGDQRAKEQLIQALIVAESYNPLEFYGYSLMSTDRQQAAPRNRAWEIVPDPKGGPGFTLEERPVEKPLQVPKYRDKQTEEDNRIKNDFSELFLQVYRKNRDSLTSEFYPLYMPLPPQAPQVAPPANWQPFSDPDALSKYRQTQLQTMMSPSGMGMGMGMGGMMGGGGFGGGGFGGGRGR